MDYVKGDGCGGGGGDQGNAVGSEGDDGIPIVLRCLLSVVSFAESENAMMMGGGGGMRRGAAAVVAHPPFSNP